MHPGASVATEQSEIIGYLSAEQWLEMMQTPHCDATHPSHAYGPRYNVRCFILAVA